MAAERFPDVPKPTEEPADYRIRLFDACRVSSGGTEIALKSREQRLVALLALQGTRPRSYLAGMLWPETAESRAAGSLRAAVWQLEHTEPGLLVCAGGQVGLNPGVAVDVRDFIERAQRISILTAQSDGPDSPYPDECLENLLVLMRGDLLSGCCTNALAYSSCG
jgi:hypothetical protein